MFNGCSMQEGPARSDIDDPSNISQGWVVGLVKHIESNWSGVFT